MIGNDIVDLQYISKSSNWNRPRFLDKIFTHQEQSIIFSSENRRETTWLLWSMKEAAYKVYIKEFGRRFFNPKAFRCELLSTTTGRVFFNELTYLTTFKHNQNYVYTTATKHYKEQTTSSVFYVSDTSYTYQSQFLRQKFLEHISKTFNIKLNTLSIMKNEIGIPKVMEALIALPIHFSLTHCGHYCGFSITE